MTPPYWNDLESVKNIHAFFAVAALVLFAVLVLFEILAHADKKRERLFTKLAIISLALAIGAEICAYPYGRRSERLYEFEVEASQQTSAENSNEIEDLKAQLFNGSNDLVELQLDSSNRIEELEFEAKKKTEELELKIKDLKEAMDDENNADSNLMQNVVPIR